MRLSSTVQELQMGREQIEQEHAREVGALTREVAELQDAQLAALNAQAAAKVEHKALRARLEEAARTEAELHATAKSEAERWQKQEAVFRDKVGKLKRLLAEAQAFIKAASSEPPPPKPPVTESTAPTHRNGAAAMTDAPAAAEPHKVAGASTGAASVAEVAAVSEACGAAEIQASARDAQTAHASSEQMQAVQVGLLAAELAALEHAAHAAPPMTTPRRAAGDTASLLLSEPKGSEWKELADVRQRARLLLEDKERE
eukprot:5261221-Prymnesium_polylepis.1